MLKLQSVPLVSHFGVGLALLNSYADPLALWSGVGLAELIC